MADNGIWFIRSKIASGISYPAASYDASYAFEDSSFWFLHRNSIIAQMYRKHRPRSNFPFVDIGGGNGFVARSLQSAGANVILVEPGKDGALNARSRGVQNVVQADFFDLETNGLCQCDIGLFDVIEHIQDDRSFLSKLQLMVAPESRVFITVPAYSWLWSDRDEEAGHFRRYSFTSLNQALEESGFTICDWSYFFAPLPLPILISNLLERVRKGYRQSEVQDYSKLHHSSKWILRILAMEAWILRRLRLPFGGSLIVVAKPRLT